MAFENITASAITFVEGLVSWSALWTLIIASFLLTLISTLVYKYTTDQKKIKEIKDEMKAMQKEMKDLKSDPKEMMEKQKEMMHKNLFVMKSAYKPLLYTFIPFLIIFFLLKEAYQPLGKIIFGLTWFWIYFITSIVFSIIIRKVFKVY